MKFRCYAAVLTLMCSFFSPVYAEETTEQIRVDKEWTAPHGPGKYTEYSEDERKSIIQKFFLYGHYYDEFNDFVRAVYPSGVYAVLKFDGLDILAVTDVEKNTVADITDTENTKYFDTEGNEITDIYAYIAEHGFEPSEGKYLHRLAQRYRNFTPIEPVIGVRDLYTDDYSEESPRARVGNSSHYLAAYNSESGIGAWVEDENGRDLLCQYDTIGIDNSQSEAVWVTDEDKEEYCVQYHSVQADQGTYYIYDRNFNEIKEGVFGSPYPPVKLGEKQTAEMTTEESIQSSEKKTTSFRDTELSKDIKKLKLQLTAISAFTAVIIFAVLKYLFRKKSAK